MPCGFDYPVKTRKPKSETNQESKYRMLEMGTRSTMNMTQLAQKRLAVMALAIFAAVDQAHAEPAERATGQDPQVVDIRDTGAVGDGKTSCTAAIQKAIDQCAARGGGTVRLPAGIWLTGTVYLESNLTLVLDKDCTLLGSRQHEDYARHRAIAGLDAKQAPFRYAAVLAGTDLQNVTIRGEGTIDGQGEAFRDKSKARPKNIYLQNRRATQRAPCSARCRHTVCIADTSRD
jgi:polygalacturonase